MLSKEFFVAGQAAGAKPCLAVLQASRQKWKPGVIDTDRQVARLRHFTGMAQETKSGNVRHCMNRKTQSDLRCPAIQLQHHSNCSVNVLGRGLAPLNGCRDQPDAKRLRKNE